MGLQNKIINKIESKKNDIPKPIESGRPGNNLLFCSNLNVILTPIRTPIKLMKKGNIEIIIP